MSLDLLLLVMVVIWGSNYSIVKAALDEVPPLAFNGVRLALASALMLLLILVASPRAERTPRALLRSPNFWVLALIGHSGYQLLFIEALGRTSVANSSLIIGCTPVFVAILTAAMGHERISAGRWGGIALSAAGIYLVVGRGAAVTGDSLEGDLMMLGAVACWSMATIASRPLLASHSPLVVTAWSMAFGTLGYLPVGWRALASVRWGALSGHAWSALLYSAALALCVAYVIWYTAVQRLGNTRTAIYSNLVPVVAMFVAWIAYGTPVNTTKILGAAAVLVGVAIARS